MVEIVPPERRRLMADVADLYYVEGKDQRAIASQLGVSRSSVSRLLSAARDSGVVEVIIHRDPPAHTELQERFAAALPEIDVSVVAADGNGSSIRSMGDRVARLVERRDATDGVLALTHGSTVHESVRALRPDRFAALRVVQMAGFELKNPLDNGWNLIRLCVDRLGPGYRYVHAPLLVSSDELHRAYLDDPDICLTLQMAREADVAIIGVGSVDPENSSLSRAGHVTQEELAAARSTGSVGAINGFHFDLDGNLLAGLNQRIVGLSPEEMRGIGWRVAVGGGIEKAAGILGAIRAGWVDALVTDVECAQEILELQDPSG